MGADTFPPSSPVPLRGEQAQSALDGVNPQFPHYKQVRAFCLTPEAFSIENGMLTANGKLKRDLISLRMKARSKTCIVSQRGGLMSSVERVHWAYEIKGQTLSWEVRAGSSSWLCIARLATNSVRFRLTNWRSLPLLSDDLENDAHALIVHSELKSDFCAGADLRELYERSQTMDKSQAVRGVRDFLERIHGVLNRIDAAPLTTIAAVHGVTFGGGFELALVCDLIIADKMARFCFPELRLGLIPGFGGIPRLKRDLGNAVVRDLLLTGRSFNASKAQQIGLVSQVVAEGEALRAARATAVQIGKI